VALLDQSNGLLGPGASRARLLAPLSYFGACRPAALASSPPPRLMARFFASAIPACLVRMLRMPCRFQRPDLQDLQHRLEGDQ